MPIIASQLKAGDILFKHSSAGALSQAIAKGQSPHYHSTVQALDGLSPTGGKSFAVDLTHVAMAVGPDDVLEFDEGSSSKWQIVMKSGHGFTRGNMKIPSRKGFRYEVFRSTSDKLAASAADKATLVWDITHQQGGTVKASYGLKKMLRTALLRYKGKTFSSLDDFEKVIDALCTLGADQKDVNIQFFCSHFVTFCYIFAAKEIGFKDVLGWDYTVGADKIRISPVELYVRVDMQGHSHFQFKGSLYAG